MRIGVDTGGTFTDVVLIDGRRRWTHKRLSTPDDPARAVLAGIDAVLARASRARDAISEVVHGSTVATNALLERRGARVALLTTEGFEDVLEIGRQTRPELHALEVRRPSPLVPVERRLGVPERLDARGETVRALDTAAIEALVERVRALGCESAAVVLLHSYTDPTHEAQLADALEPLGLPLTVSHRLLPEYREYERTTTCVVNAYVAPKMAGYLARLEAALAGARLRVMQSNGGSIAARRAADDAVHTILSGPAGGVVGGAELAGREGWDRLITFDMGGTSTDVCLVEGEPTVTSQAEVAGLPLRVPLLDIHTVGAGGGSIGWQDAGGALRVGPRSAGATPGPACYGRGGTEPTVTDAHLLLGRLHPDQRLGGSLALDEAAAHAAVGRLAARASLTAPRCAEGILAVANAVMARAIRRISLERGHDPRRFALISFGGAGGLHACELAELLSMPRVLVPPDPGLLCATGMLAAHPRKERGHSVLLRTPADGGALPADRLSEVYDALETELRGELVAEGFAAASLSARRSADLRYAGQSFELNVPVEPADLRAAVEAFHEAHRRAFGYALEREVEWVTARVRVHGPTGEAPAARAPSGAPLQVRGGRLDRESLPAGSRVTGPASITEYSGTTWVPAGWAAEVTSSGALLLERSEP